MRLKGDLFGRLRSFFEREEEQLRHQLAAAKRRELKAEALSAALSMDKERAEQLNAQLIERLGHPQGSVGGSIQLLNFEAIAEKIGPRWAGMLPRIHSIIDGVLASRLSADEVYYRQGDSQYVLVFDSLDEESAGRRCRAIESAIRRKLLGEDSVFEGINLQSTVAAIRPGAAEEGEPAAAIAAQVRRFGTRVTAGDEDESTSDPTSDLRQKLNQVLALLDNVASGLAAGRDTHLPEEERTKQLDRLERVARMVRDAELAITGSEQKGGLAALQAGHPALLGGEQDRFAAVLDRMLETIRSELHQLGHAATGDGAAEPKPAAGPAANDAGPAGVEFSYLPIWQVQKQVLNVFLCTVAMQIDDAFASAETLIDSVDDDPAIVAALDQLVLLKAIADLESTLDPNRSHLIIVPVHFSTLSTPHLRRQFIQNCRALRQEYRKYLVFELIYPYIGVSNLPVVNAISIVKPFARAILLRVSLDYPSFTDLTAAGLFSVGADLGSVPLSETELANKINLFKTKAERARLHTHLYGINSLSMAVTAIGAGFDFLGGSAIAAPIDGLDSMQGFALATLFQRRGMIQSG